MGKNNYLKKIIEGSLLTISLIALIYAFNSDLEKFYKSLIASLILLISVEYSLIDAISFIKTEKWWYKNRNIVIMVVLFFLTSNLNKNKIISLQYYYLICFLGIILFLKLLINIFNLIIENKDIQQKNSFKLLSFRKQELEELTKLVENKEIPTILLDNKIGNGKTKLIETFISENKDSEIIYLKLPLIGNINNFKNSLYLEINRIFKKNNISTNYLSIFFKKISSFKTKNFELNFNCKDNNWESMKQLKESLIKLETPKYDKKINKKIIIIVDDIEREEDANYIKESIFFLGEFSENFRDTKTTTIFLAQYDDILKKLQTKQNGKKGIQKFNSRKLDKYFSYIFSLKKIQLEFLERNDISILISELYGENENQKYLDLIYELLTNLKNSIEKIEFSIDIFRKNENIRNIKKYISSVTTVVKNEDIGKSFGIIESIFILIDIFFLDEEMSLEIKNRLSETLYKDILFKLNLNKEIPFDKDQILEIKGAYIRKEKIGDNFLLSIEKKINYLKTRNIRFVEDFNELNYSDINFIFEYISFDKEKINRFLELNISFDIYSHIKRINEYIERNLLSEKATNNIKNLFLSEVPKSNRDEQLDAENEMRMEEMEEREKEYYNKNMTKKMKLQQFKKELEQEFKLADGLFYNDRVIEFKKNKKIYIEQQLNDYEENLFLQENYNIENAY